MIPAEFALVLHLLLVLAAVYSIICRARLMDSNTRWSIRWQHGWLCAGLLMSLGVPEAWRAPTMAAGVLVFLGLSSGRWRHEAPPDTVRGDL